MPKTLFDKVWEAHVVERPATTRPFSTSTGIWCMK